MKLFAFACLALLSCLACVRVSYAQAGVVVVGGGGALPVCVKRVGVGRRWQVGGAAVVVDGEP